jgi:type II secretory pathway pseudopilin PulG
MKATGCSDRRRAFESKRETSPVAGTGFTLIEVLVAATLTIVLATLVLAAVSGVMNHWNRTAGRLATAADARLVLGQLAEDLQGAIFRADGNVWMAVTVQADTGLSGQWRAAARPSQEKPGNAHPETLDLATPSMEDARFGVAGVWLRFFTTKQDTSADAANLSAPTAVSYQIVRQNVTASAASEQRYLLFRAEVRRTRTAGGAPGTFEAGYDLNPEAVPATFYQTPSGTAGDPGNLIRPPLGSVLADNVIDFGVRLYLREGADWRLVFPAAPAAARSMPAGGLATHAAPPAFETQHLAMSAEPATADYYRHAFPEVVEVMIRVLTDEGARRISAFENGRLQPPAGVTPADYWWILAEAHSRVFTRRIAIASRPP